MDKRTVVLVAALAASAASVWYFASAPAPVAGRAAAPAAPAAAPPPATPPAPTAPKAALPPPDAPLASIDAVLRERAFAGDGAAAWRWYRDQADCRRWHDWSAAPDGFARRLIDAAATAGSQPPFFAMPPEELEAFRNPANTAEVAAANAQNLMERLEKLCDGAPAASDDDVYRGCFGPAPDEGTLTFGKGEVHTYGLDGTLRRKLATDQTMVFTWECSQDAQHLLVVSPTQMKYIDLRTMTVVLDSRTTYSIGGFADDGTFFLDTVDGNLEVHGRDGATLARWKSIAGPHSTWLSEDGTRIVLTTDREITVYDLAGKVIARMGGFVGVSVKVMV